MERLHALVIAAGLAGFGGALSVADDTPQPAAVEKRAEALYMVHRVCFKSDGRCIDDHGRAYDQDVSVADCTRVVSAKIGPLKSGNHITRAYCQMEPDRGESYQEDADQGRKD